MIIISFTAKIFLSVAVILSGIGLVLTKVRNDKIRNGIECEGKIVRFVKLDSSLSADTNSHTVISPVIRYKVEEKEYEFTGGYVSRNAAVGDSVTVLYDKDEITKATIKNGRNLAITILCGLSFLFLVVGSIFIIFKR